MEEESYLERKIDFVTGHTGSSLWDINQVTLVAPVSRAFLSAPRSSSQNVRF